jgi:hypothetical protein
LKVEKEGKEAFTSIKGGTTSKQKKRERGRGRGREGESTAGRGERR